MPPDELSVEIALELLSKQSAGDEPMGVDPVSGRPVFVKQGRFGPYVQLGNSDEEDNKKSSLLKGMNLADMDLETALKLLSLPRQLGINPQNNEEVIAKNGRFGPYVECGSDTRSLPDSLGLLDITLEQALVLLSQPKTGRAARPLLRKNL